MVNKKADFDSNYYNKDYFVTPAGKKYTAVDGSEQGWSYANPTGEFLGCEPIAKAWKQMFTPKDMLDVGAGRGTFISYARDQGIEAIGFDYSDWAVSDEGRYYRCEAEWLTKGDVISTWDYPDNSFELVTCLDLLEHIYEPDIGKVFDEIYRVSKKWVFLLIATTPEGDGYILKKGEEIPEEWQGCAVAGHVIVKQKAWWMEKILTRNWVERKDKLLDFCDLVEEDVIANWIQNTILILEKKNG